jgi:carbamoyltransferase
VRDVRILGISAFYHDAAAVLLADGRIVAAAQEERFTRKKHDARFPAEAIRYCLEAGGIGAHDLDLVAFYDKPFLKFERLLETYLAFAPRGFRSFRMAMPLWIKEKLFQKSLLARELKAFEPTVDWAGRLLFSEHHQSHAASAFFASPFREAAVLTLDGVGEWATASIGRGEGNRRAYASRWSEHLIRLLGIQRTQMTLLELTEAAMNRGAAVRVAKHDDATAYLETYMLVESGDFFTIEKED